MVALRDKTPLRRPILKNVAHWTEHKPDLKIDFNNHCAYCHSHDGYRHTYFEVDHFIPKVFFRPLGHISDTQYDNLVYSCKFCNNKKLSKWPSQSETIFNDGLEGFVDPCTEEYTDHLYRRNDGAIMWKTDLGKWMHTVAFKFDERERGIKLIWNLERLDSLIGSIEELLAQLDPYTNATRDLKHMLHEYAYEYLKFDRQLRQYYDSL